MLALATSLSACAGGIADPEPFLQAAGQSQGGLCTLTNVHHELIVPKCGSCHSSALMSGGLDLKSDGAPARVIGKAATCAGVNKPLVDASDPTKGFLYDKLGSKPGCGSQMPVGGSLTAQEVACIGSWLQDAAGGGN